MGMKLVAWNVNSIKTRLERTMAFLERESPDVVCIQEIKCEDHAFPIEAFEQAGYSAILCGQKTYHGVAILSRLPIELVRIGVGDPDLDKQARLVVGAVDAGSLGAVTLASAYFPNGGEVGSEKWTYKLAWFAALTRLLDAEFDPAAPLAIAGDYNVAPRDTDVANPEKWADSVLCHPDARAALEKLASWGLRDVFADHHPEGGLYSWWDYRRLAFPKGDGLRIDHVLCTPPLADRAAASRVDRDERKGKQPSDHAPVIVEFEGS